MGPIVIVRLSRIVVVILYAIPLITVLVCLRANASVKLEIVEDFKKDHLAVINVISIHHVLVTLGNVVVIIMQADVQENVILTVLALVIAESVPAMDTIQDVLSVILTVLVLAIVENALVMGMILDVTNAIVMEHVAAIQVNALVMDTIQDVENVMDILSVIVIQFVVMIVQQIMVNAL